MIEALLNDKVLQAFALDYIMMAVLVTWTHLRLSRVQGGGLHDGLNSSYPSLRGSVFGHCLDGLPVDRPWREQGKQNWLLTKSQSYPTLKASE